MSIKLKAIMLALLIAVSSGSIYFYLDKQVVEIGWVGLWKSSRFK